MKSRLHRRFLPACEAALETRLVLSDASPMSLASSAAATTSASTPTSEVSQTPQAPPTLAGVSAVKDGRGRITAIEVHYSSKMDAATASNANNFVLLQKTVRGRRIASGGFDRVASASYDDARAATTLVLSRPVPSNYLYVRPGASRFLVVQLETPSTIGLANQDGYKGVVS